MSCSAATRLREGSSFKSRMISPPRTQRLSTCLWMVLLDSSDVARCIRKGVKHSTSFLPGGRILFLAHPTLRPLLKIAAVWRQRGGRRWGRMGTRLHLRIDPKQLMRLPRILNQCHPIPGFVYGQASFAEDGQAVLIPVRPRKRSAAICSGCHQPAPGYDQSHTPRRFEFIGFWGYLVFLVYCMRRVDCKQCGVVVEEVAWGVGKHSSTKVYMHFLGHWARKLSWK